MSSTEYHDTDYDDWRKSTRSNGSGACVETAAGVGTVAVRDTADRDGGMLTFTAEAWRKFTATVRLAGHGRADTGGLSPASAVGLPGDRARFLCVPVSGTETSRNSPALRCFNGSSSRPSPLACQHR